jgi:ABC-type Fe3+ transport system substrate-binding protein
MDMSFYENAKANDALLSDRAGKIGETVASGEAALGVGPHDPVVRLQNKAKKEGVESPVNITWSADGAYVIQRPIAIINKSDRSESVTETAKAFVDFILSKQGQTIIAKKGGFVPMNTEVESPALVPADLTLQTIDWDWAFENSEAITNSFQEIMFND